jgi:hypothetical protein
MQFFRFVTLFSAIAYVFAALMLGTSLILLPSDTNHASGSDISPHAMEKAAFSSVTYANNKYE